VSFEVSDTGIGIPPDKHHQIFEAFTQANSSTTRQYGGTGLGLTISARLVQLMGGQIRVESDAGRGSRFRFNVWLARQRAQGESPGQVEAAHLRGLPVLIADDHAANRRVFQQILLNWNMKPTTSDSGRAALGVLREAAARGAPFPLLLLDAMMPEMDGLMLARQMQHFPELAAVKTILLVSPGRTHDADTLRELGIAVHLTKPIKPSELLHAILSALGKAPLDNQTARQRGVPGPVVSRRRLRILLVEDNPVNRIVAVSLLEKHEHQVTAVGDGKEALARLEKETFDLVLMDVQMPEMDGFEATAIIRALEQGTARHMPIIAMTAHALKGDRERCLAAGMDDYIAKPVRPSDLVQVLAPYTAPAGETVPPILEVDHADGLWSRATLLGLLGGNIDRLDRMVRLFVDESARLMAEIRDGLARGHAATVQQAAHSLKGATAVFGAAAAADAAERMETLGQDADLTGAASAMPLLETELERLRATLAEFATVR
jgi:CheY-like chemotaxis protein/HPt (histidine-containing phosphotransfer) domain-containing protein